MKHIWKRKQSKWETGLALMYYKCLFYVKEPTD